MIRSLTFLRANIAAIGVAAALAPSPIASLATASPRDAALEAQVALLTDAFGEDLSYAEPLAPTQATRPRLRAGALLKRVLDGGADAARITQGDPVLRDLVAWRRLRQNTGDWTAYADFLERRPHWPERAALRARAETRMPEDAAVDLRLAFFRSDEPRTARGARLYGEALIASGRRALGQAWIIRGWRERSAGGRELARYRDGHGALIAPYVEARFETALWAGRAAEARGLARELGPGYEALARARRALVRGERGVDARIAAIPEALRDHPAILQGRMLWRARRGRTAEAEQAVLEASADQSLGEAEAWADRRMRLARDAFEDGRPEDAYALASQHGLLYGGDFAELEWFAGWIALRELGQPDVALRHFVQLWSNVYTPISRGRAAFWAGEAAAAMRDEDAAATWRRRAQDFPTSFYGQLAASQARAPLRFPVLGGENGPGWSRVDDDLARAATALYRAGETREARLFLRRLMERRSTEQGARRVLEICRRWGDGWGEIDAASVAYRSGLRLWSGLFPVPRDPNFISGAPSGVEPELLLAVARQESRFSADAVSHAGARGLMQLMPSTARATARRLRLPYEPARLTENPEYNLTLGGAVMDELLTYFDGSYVLAIAGYNGGAGNVLKWIRRNGDPRDGDVDVVDWIESIPFHETRNYVHRVLESLQVYRARLSVLPHSVALDADLRRGRRSQPAN